MGEIGLFTRLDRAIINFGGSRNALKTVDCYLSTRTRFSLGLITAGYCRIPQDCSGYRRIVLLHIIFHLK